MDEEKEILLREWEQRYESYRAYTRSYLTWMSVAVTGYAVGMSLILTLGIAPMLRIALLAMVLFFLTVVLLAHRITLKEFTRLGQRLDNLEGKLGIEIFATAQPLRTAVVTSFWGVMFIWVATLAVAIYFIVSEL